MKFEPIKNPDFYGCLNCSPSAETTLTLEEEVCIDIAYGLNCIHVYFGNSKFTNYIEESNFESNDITLRQLIDVYSDALEKSDAFLIEFETAMHGEIYEFNREDNLFYLVEQTQGWC